MVNELIEDEKDAKAQGKNREGSGCRLRRPATALLIAQTRYSASWRFNFLLYEMKAHIIYSHGIV